MAHPAPRVSVVITHYRSPEALLTCLDALADATNERLGEVFVVDSEAQPDLRPRVDRHRLHVTYVPVPRNVGFGALVNRGLLASTDGYAMVLNADVRVDDGCLDALAAHLDADRSCGMVAPQVRNDDGSLQHTAFRYYRPATVAYRHTALGRTATGRAELARFLDRERLERAVSEQAPMPADWVLGAAMCVRRSALADVGEMDASYFLYFEDVDWCLRFWQGGWAVHYLPRALCHHTHGRGSAAGGRLAALTNPLTRRHVRSALRFFRKHGLRAQRPVRGPWRGAPALEPTIDLTHEQRPPVDLVDEGLMERGGEPARPGARARA